MLYNIRREGPYPTQEVLIQALVISHLEYCNSLLAGLPRLCHQTPAIYTECCSLPGVQPRTLHWFPVKARIHYKTMVLYYGAARGTVPPYLQAMLKPYIPIRALRSDTSRLISLTIPLSPTSSDFADNIFEEKYTYYDCEM